MISEGMVAVVTGGAQGIGRSICVSLASRGVKVISLDVKDESNRITEKLMREFQPQSKAMHCDVSDPRQIDSVFSEIIENEGGIDILVNNAAVFSTTSFAETSYEDALKDWSYNIDTNARSTFLCSKKAAPSMIKKGHGEIVNIITNHVKRCLFPPSDSEHSYDASKYAQLSLNESMARELSGYGIRVNAVCPAATRSPMLTEFFDSIGMELNRETIGHVSGFASLLECEEVAEAVCAIMNWNESEPTGQAYLLMYSEDCAELENGHSERLSKQVM
ncbi:MAG: SDR family NAD(P)-dependent oxidoreductase [bacterium]|nr:SDR family NAD(P)-dependent oxidoreductase [bacterium]